MKKQHLILVLSLALLLAFCGPKLNSQTWLARTQLLNSLPATKKISSEKILYKIRTKEKLVALTVDDGPDPSFTPKLLDILKENNIHATFFVLGSQLEKYPDIGMRLLEEGNEIGNHTYSHPELPSIDASQIANEITQGTEAIQRVLGTKTKFFRAPKGLINDDVLRIAKEQDQLVIKWSITLEHRDSPTPHDMATRVIDKITPGGIILMHDGRLDRTRSIEALPVLIKGLQEKGYKFVTLSELLALGEQKEEERAAEKLSFYNSFLYTVINLVLAR